MDIVFTSNDSEVTRLEGVYIKERKPPASISGANFSAVAVAGECARGPVDTIIRCTSPTRFEEVFGGRDDGNGGPITGQVWLSLLNKPFGTLVVVRVAAKDATPASKTFADATPILRVAAANPGVWGNQLQSAVTPASDGDAQHFNLEVSYRGRRNVYPNLDCSGTADNLLSVIGNDDTVLITATKLASGRPANAPIANLSGGSNGTIGDADYTASGRGLNLLKPLKDVGARWVAGRSNEAIKTAIVTAAATTHNGFWLIGPDDERVSDSLAAVEVATYPRSDRVIYCFNHPYTLDVETATEVVTEPMPWLASILSQTDVDIHPGDEDTKPLLAGIKRLSFEALDREAYVALRAAGITALERDDGFVFVSGRTTDLTPGREEITRRRMTDYIELGAAPYLKHLVKKAKTEARRKLAIGALISFLQRHKSAERVVREYAIREVDAGRGVFKLFTQVDLIDHALSIVLETEIGIGVQIQNQAR